MVSTRPSLGQIVAGVVLCEVVGIAGGLFTASSVNGWYQTLEKPGIAPPNWVFAPVWTVLYALLGIALAYLWAAPPNSVGRAWALRWFWIGLVLNLAWSAAFFGWRAPALGYAVICALWFAIVGLMWTGTRAARPTLWLLLPYLAWVTFASALNFGVLSLNVLRHKVAQMDNDPKNADAPLSQQGLIERNRERAKQQGQTNADEDSP